MRSTSHYLDACAEAWVNCEVLLHSLGQKKIPFSQRTTQVLDECATICLGTMRALKDGWKELNQMALLCMGLCEECAEICERYADADFQLCAATCKKCAATVSFLASKAA